MPRDQHHANEGSVSDSCSASYVLLTAAYNEEAFIERTIDSVLSQSMKPSVWVIVSDGSTDRTDEIVKKYAASHSFIRLLRRGRDCNRGFASKVFALRAGFESTVVASDQYIGHLDADVELPPSYFRDLLLKFDDDQTLGIAGGWYYEQEHGRFRPARGSSPTSIPGGIQMFRRACYQDIGGLLPIEYGGEDWYAEIMARKRGWRVQSFPELVVLHLRPPGTRDSLLRYCYHQGFMDFSLGTHPVFEFVKLVRRVPWHPVFFGAIARLLGFLVAHFRGTRMVPPDCVEFLRSEQMARLWPHPSSTYKDIL